MNTTTRRVPSSGRTLVAAAVASVLIAACATPQLKPAGADARAKLTQLQSNPELATRAPVEIKEAEAAVRAAEELQAGSELAQHRSLRRGQGPLWPWISKRS
jgi:hypothetical protein